MHRKTGRKKKSLELTAAPAVLEAAAHIRETSEGRDSHPSDPIVGWIIPEAVMRAACHGEVDVVTRWLDSGGHIDAREIDHECTLLHGAASGGHDRLLVELVVRRHADLETACDDGTTALHWAAAEGHSSATTHLLRAGARADARNDKGETPLQLAVRAAEHDSKLEERSGALAAAQVLREHAASSGRAKLQDYADTTPCAPNERDIAAEAGPWDPHFLPEPVARAALHGKASGHAKIREWLDERGGHIDAHDSRLDSSVLMLCAAGKHDDIVEWLIGRGANLDLQVSKITARLHTPTGA